jgi:hypothetical protein
LQLFFFFEERGKSFAFYIDIVGANMLRPRPKKGEKKPKAVHMVGKPEKKAARR